MKNQWKFMNMFLNPEELPTMKELLQELQDNGSTDAALAKLREAQIEKYHNELIWRYPISEGEAAGGFIMPVQEGILWIPYDEMEKEAGEILLTDDAVLLSEDACKIMADDFSRYADGLCDMLRQSARICRRIKLGMNKTRVGLGHFVVVSGKLTVSDPCFETDIWCSGELDNVLNGGWFAYVIKKDGGEYGERISQLIAVHECYRCVEFPKGQCAGFEVGVDSGQAGIFDAALYRVDSSVPDGVGNTDGIWYDYCCQHTLSSRGAGILPYGAVSSSGHGDGSYDCFINRNDDGKIVRVEIEFIPEDEGDA